MSGIFDQFRKKVVTSVFKDADQEASLLKIDDKIALGVLLYTVAEADDQFLPKEKEKIKEILQKYNKIEDNEIELVMESIETASAQKIDLYSFTSELSKDLQRQVKIDILENLFRVACIDGDLAHNEHEIIRKISGLFQLEHRDFINSKLKVKKEFGLETSGL